MDSFAQGGLTLPSSSALDRGLANYQALFSSVPFGAILQNSLFFSLLPSVLAVALAFVAVALFSKIRRLRVRLLCYAICGFFAFIPDVSVFTFVFLSNPANDSAAISVVWILLFHTLQDFSMAAIFGGFVACLLEGTGRHGFLSRYAGVLLYGLYALANLLTQPTSLPLFLLNSMTQKSLFTVDSFVYQMSLMQPGISSSAWVLKTIPQLIFGIVGFFLCAFILRRVKSGGHGSSSDAGLMAPPKFTLPVALLIAGGVAGAAGLLLYFSMGQLVQGLSGTILITMSASLIFLVVFAIISAFSSPWKRSWVPATLLLLTAFSGNTVSAYLLSRGPGGLFLPMLFLLACNIPLLFMGAVFSRIGGRKSIRYLLFIGGLFIVVAAGNTFIPLIGVSSDTLTPLPVYLHNIISGYWGNAPSFTHMVTMVINQVNGSLILMGVCCWFVFTGLLLLLPGAAAKKEPVPEVKPESPSLEAAP